MQAAAQMMAIVSDNRMAQLHVARMQELDHMHGIDAHASFSKQGVNVGGSVTLSWDEDMPQLV